MAEPCESGDDILADALGEENPNAKGTRCNIQMMQPKRKRKGRLQRRVSSAKKTVSQQMLLRGANLK
jgi:hypothetical protein